jgi:predicted metalloprotease with PDZ domain
VRRPVSCLVADVTIRRQTNNSKGLQDALRAIVATGGTIDKEWSLAQVLKIGDRATGTTVLVDMYKSWSGSPSHVDLQSLWTELGIHLNKDTIVLDSDASLARIRDSITTRPLVASAN